jgi:hypothetical protein
MPYLAKPELSISPTPSRTARASSPTVSKSVERCQLKLSRTPGGANQSGTSSPAAAPNCAPAAASRSWMGVVRSGRAAVSSSLGKRIEKRRE